MNDGIRATATCVTVAQLANANRVHNTAPFKLGNTTFQKVILLGNLAGVPEIGDSGDLQFTLDDSTGRILVKLFEPKFNFPLSPPNSEHPFSTLLRVTGTLFVPRRSNFRMLKAEHCSLIEDPHAPYHHLLQAVVDYMQNEKGPFPSDPPTIVEQVTSDRQDEEEANWEQGGADFQELTSSLANTKLDASDVPDGLPIPVKPRDKESSSGSGGSSGHLYPPQSPLRQSVSPPRVAYYPKATSGELDNSFVFLDTEGAPQPPKPNGSGIRHVYPPHSQYPRDIDLDMSAGAEEEAPAPVCAPPTDQTDFAENGDLDESFVFLDSNQVQSRANGAPYLPSTRHRIPLVSEMSISPPRSFLRRHSPPQRDTPSKKARIDPYSRLNALERDIILTISTRSQPVSLYYNNDKSNNATSQEYIIQTLTKKRPELSSREIVTVLEKLVNEGYLVRPIDQDHFVIN